MTRLIIAAALLAVLAGCSDEPHRFASCTEAQEAGAPLPLTADSPGWNPKLDRDGNGVACS